jgi:hypothetical protein
MYAQVYTPPKLIGPVLSEKGCEILRNKQITGQLVNINPRNLQVSYNEGFYYDIKTKQVISTMSDYDFRHDKRVTLIPKIVTDKKTINFLINESKKNLNYLESESERISNLIKYTKQFIVQNNS